MKKEMKKREENANEGGGRKSTRQKKGTRRALQTGVDDAGRDHDNDDEPSVTKRTKTLASSFPQGTAISTDEERN